MKPVCHSGPAFTVVSQWGRVGEWKVWTPQYVFLLVLSSTEFSPCFIPWETCPCIQVSAEKGFCWTLTDIT